METLLFFLPLEPLFLWLPNLLRYICPARITTPHNAFGFRFKKISTIYGVSAYTPYVNCKFPKTFPPRIAVLRVFIPPNVTANYGQLQWLQRFTKRMARGVHTNTLGSKCRRPMFYLKCLAVHSSAHRGVRVYIYIYIQNSAWP